MKTIKNKSENYKKFKISKKSKSLFYCIYIEKHLERYSRNNPYENTPVDPYTDIFIDIRQTPVIIIDMDALYENRVKDFIASFQISEEFKSVLGKYLFGTGNVERELLICIMDDFAQYLKVDILMLLLVKIAETYYLHSDFRKVFYDNKIVETWLEDWESTHENNWYKNMIASYTQKYDELNLEKNEVLTERCINFVKDTRCSQEIWPVCFFMIYRYTSSVAKTNFGLADSEFNAFFEEKMLPRLSSNVKSSMGFDKFLYILKDENLGIVYEKANMYILNHYTNFYDMKYCYTKFQQELRIAKSFLRKKNFVKKLISTFAACEEYQDSMVLEDEIINGLKDFFSLAGIYTSCLKRELLFEQLPFPGTKAACYGKDFVDAFNNSIMSTIDLLLDEIIGSCGFNGKQLEELWFTELLEYSDYIDYTDEFKDDGDDAYHLINRIFAT